jgi:hypothetical protein
MGKEELNNGSLYGLTGGLWCGSSDASVGRAAILDSCCGWRVQMMCDAR